MQVEHIFLFGKSKRFSDESADTLAQGVVEPLDMVGQSGFPADQEMCLLGQTMISLPKIAETPTFQVLAGQFAPQAFARFHGAVTDEKGDDLPCSMTLDDPDPYLIDFHGDISEHLVHF
jgi:hypothetical protein